MIVTPSNGELRTVTQPDHARFAAELIGLWRLPELVEHPRRRSLLVAVREHDNGWREADAAPSVDDAGRPHTFMTLPDEWRDEIWRRGTRRLVTSDPFAALLVTEHALRLLDGRRDDGLMTELHERRDDLIERSGSGDEEVRASYRYLAIGDALSLLVCGDGGEAVERGDWRGTLDGEDLVLTPFPLVGATTFRIPCRRIPDRRYDSDTDLAVTLARARWEQLSVRVRAA